MKLPEEIMVILHLNHLAIIGCRLFVVPEGRTRANEAGMRPAGVCAGRILTLVQILEHIHVFCGPAVRVFLDL